MIEAIVFDFDGLILDTETHEYAALAELFEENGARLPLQVWGKAVGTKNAFNPYEYLEECTGMTLDHGQLKALRNEKFEQLIKHEKALPGVENNLLAAKELGLKIGLASSSARAWVEKYLKRLNLLEYFDCIRTQDDVKRVKPDPELYLSVLHCLGVRPEHSLAFEDSPNGSLGAKRAGMLCVVVPNSITSQLSFEHVDVDLQLKSMEERSLRQLIQHFSQ